MTMPSNAEALTRLIREFMTGLRDHLTDKLDGQDPEVVAERIFATVAALAAAVLMLMPNAGRREQLITALLSLVHRFFRARAGSGVHRVMGG